MDSRQHGDGRIGHDAGSRVAVKRPHPAAQVAAAGRRSSRRWRVCRGSRSRSGSKTRACERTMWRRARTDGEPPAARPRARVWFCWSGLRRDCWNQPRWNARSLRPSSPCSPHYTSSRRRLSRGTSVCSKFDTCTPTSHGTTLCESCVGSFFLPFEGMLGRMSPCHF